MQVHGRDVATEAYRVSVACRGQRVTGLVPEALMRSAAPGAARHRTAYDWLARHRADIEAALCAKREGRRPRPPFDRVTLAEE